MSTRTAEIKGNGITAQRVEAYLPANYNVIGSVVLAGAVTVYIKGEDSMGWTFDDYVSPRLASGCMFATKVEPTCHLPHWINPDTGECEHTDHDAERDPMTEPCPHTQQRFVDHLNAFVCMSCSAVDEAQ